MARRQRFNICVGTEPTQDRIECLSAQKEPAYRVRVRLVRVIKVADHGRKKNAKSELKIPFTGKHTTMSLGGFGAVDEDFVVGD